MGAKPDRFLKENSGPGTSFVDRFNPDDEQSEDDAVEGRTIFDPADESDATSALK